MNDLSCVIPAYNETAVGDTVGRLRKVLNQTPLQYEIIVVDDGSDVPIQVRGAMVLRHAENMGYGASLKTGILKAKGERILIIDADGTYPVEALSQLLEGDFDMSVGARTKSSANIPLYRRPAKWFLGYLANYLSRTKIPDLNSGMRVFRKEAAMRYMHLYPRGFSFTTTITLAFLCDDLTVNFVPIDYHPRTGSSKIRPFKDGFNFIMLIIRTITYFSPLRVFLPVSAVLLALAMLFFLYSTLVLGKVMDITVIVLFVSSIQTASFGLLAELIVKRVK
jgi:glycosyltransferase involved in cell wall biosynthesis